MMRRRNDDPHARLRELTDLYRLGVGLTVVAFGTGLIYATGIGKNQQTVGFLLLAWSGGMLWGCWWIRSQRRRLKAEIEAGAGVAQSMSVRR